MPDINCNEAQENELEAIKAIYMDDFEMIDSNVRTWKVTKKFKEFRIKLRPMDSDLNELIEVSLRIKLPPAYPAISPEVVLETHKGLNEKQFLDLKSLVKNKISEFTGSEMIFDLCDVILEYITCNHVSSEKSSFFDQMTKRQEKMVKEEKERAIIEKENNLRIQKEKEELEKITLSKALEAELFKKEQRLQDERLKKKLIRTDYNLGSKIEFDKPIKIHFQSSHFQSLTFTSVTLGSCVAKDEYSKTYFALPHKPITNSDNLAPPLLLEEIMLFPQADNTLQAIDDLRKIEETLDKLKNIRHPGLLNIYEFKVDDLDITSFSWKLLVLSETRLLSSSLRNALKKCGPLSIQLTREYFKEMLKAVHTLHQNNINYNFIRTDRVVLDAEEEGTENRNIESYFDQVYSSVKFMSRNHLLFSTHLNDSALATDLKWPPPEVTYGEDLTSKADVWDLGLVLVEMLLGTKIYQSQSSLTDLLESSFGYFDLQARDLLCNMLQESPDDRPTVQALLRHPFFKSDTITMTQLDSFSNLNSSLSQKTPNIISSSPDSLPSSSFQYRSMLEHTNIVPKSISRYENDFEEIHFLGKGGFGEVVKSRNKLDGRIYAVKRVRLDPKDTENSRKILREVAALSRLHHQYIVRYYTAWLEDANGAWDEDDEDSYSEASSLDDDECSQDSDSEGIEGDFLYTEKSTTFSLKKSSPIRFAESREVTISRVSDSHFNGSNSQGRNKGLLHRCLYIQMEYCDKNTLRDVIDEGISIDESWRILRQILEGLDHLHSQGMIHRDLKPSNIFLASNGDVKIGDFGLATSSNTMSEGIGSMKVSYEIYNGSMTSDVGTSFYMSPEVASKSSRYNQKVDMYSLGIIFFEMIYPFSTGMERAVALRDLRLPSIIFPNNFSVDTLKGQAQIIKRLLNHDEKERPTSLGLLQSNLLPTRMEDEYIQECIRTIANPATPHYSKLMSTLFQQGNDRHKDLIFDHKSRCGYDLPAAMYSEFIRSILTRVFRRHGAVEFGVPLLMPRIERFSEIQKPAYLLDSVGTIVQMPYDLTLPFARFVARAEVCSIKRFVFDRVYRQNAEDDSPLEVQEADFDIINQLSGDVLSEAEVIKVVDEVMDAFPPGVISDYHFQINHGVISTMILDACKVPKNKRSNVAVILSQLEVSKTLPQIRALLSRSHLPKAMVEELMLFYVSGDLSSAQSKLRKMSFLKQHKPTIDRIFSELKKLQDYLKRLGVTRQVNFNSFCMYNLNYYESGMIFRAVRDTKRGDILAVGGRYDCLISRYRSPLLPNVPVKFGVGVSIALQKLTLLLSQYEAQKTQTKKADDDRSHAIWIPKMLDVYVTTFNKGLLEERLEVVRDLWAHQIRCDYRHDDEPELSMDNLLQLCRSQGANWLVLIKSSRKEGHTVKVRNILSKTETEVSITELSSYLQTEITEQTRADLLAAGLTSRKKGDLLTKFSLDDEGLTNGLNDMSLSSSSNHPSEENGIGPFNVSVINPSPNRITSKRKRQLMDRALEAVVRIAKNAFKPSTPILVVELPRESLRKFLDCSIYDEEQVKKVASTLPPNQRAQFQATRTQLVASFDADTDKVGWLYSTRDDCAVLYSLSNK